MMVMMMMVMVMMIMTSKQHDGKDEKEARRVTTYNSQLTTRQFEQRSNGATEQRIYGSVPLFCRQRHLLL